jgi:hypothetical protein
MTTDQHNKRLLTQADLNHFTGTTQYWQTGLAFHPFLYTDGVQFLVSRGEAYWLLDLIGSWQYESAVKNDRMLGEMQFWTLTVRENKTALAICERDSGDVVVKQAIPFTDFPLPKVRLYLAHMENYWRYSPERGPRTIRNYGILLLSSEY